MEVIILQNKVKVLMFVDRMRHGGIQQFILENVKHMDLTKLTIDVLTLDDGQNYPLEQEVQDVGANFYKLKGVWVQTPYDYITYAKAIQKFFQQHSGYKVIHMNASSKNFILLRYAKRYGIPVRIAHSHNIDFQTNNIIKKCAGNIFKIILNKYATDYFACSKLAGKWLFGKKYVEQGKVIVIHNAVDFEKFQFNKEIREIVRNELRISNDALLIGNVGRFTLQKNHIFLLDIFNEIQKKKDAVLILIGIGELEAEIREKVQILNLTDKVIFAGFRNDVYKVLQAMDVFLLPSLYEGLPIVGVEAQANGLPIFTSKDVVTNEVKISDSLTFISLEKTAENWAEIILQSDLTRRDTKEQLKKAGYFIEDAAKALSKFYLRSLSVGK